MSSISGMSYEPMKTWIDLPGETIAKLQRKRLPAKLWRLIELAVKDVEFVRMRPDKYRLNMDTWHTPVLAERHSNPPKVCAVCFAGAVMAGTLAPKLRDVALEPSDTKVFNEVTARRLRSLDDVRIGELSAALYTFYGIDAVEMTAAQARMTARFDKALRELSMRRLYDYRNNQSVFYFSGEFMNNSEYKDFIQKMKRVAAVLRKHDL